MMINNIAKNLDKKDTTECSNNGRNDEEEEEEDDDRSFSGVMNGDSYCGQSSQFIKKDMSGGKVMEAFQNEGDDEVGEGSGLIGGKSFKRHDDDEDGVGRDGYKERGDKVDKDGYNDNDNIMSRNDYKDELNIFTNHNILTPEHNISTNKKTSLKVENNNNNNQNNNNNNNNKINCTNKPILKTTSNKSSEHEDLAYPGFEPRSLYFFHQTSWPRNKCLQLLTSPYPLNCLGL